MESGLTITCAVAWIPTMAGTRGHLQSTSASTPTPQHWCWRMRILVQRGTSETRRSQFPVTWCPHRDEGAIPTFQFSTPVHERTQRTCTLYDYKKGNLGPIPKLM